MAKKSELLNDLGWEENLINHFMIDDGDYSEPKEDELETELFETNSMTFTYNAGHLGSYTINRG